MMPHHAGAVEMCAVLQDSIGDADAYLTELCANVTRTQRAEIACVPAFMRACVRVSVVRALVHVRCVRCVPSCACVRVCVRACVRVRVCACVRACVRAMPTAATATTAMAATTTQ